MRRLAPFGAGVLLVAVLAACGPRSADAGAGNGNAVGLPGAAAGQPAASSAAAVAGAGKASTSAQGGSSASAAADAALLASLERTLAAADSLDKQVDNSLAGDATLP